MNNQQTTISIKNDYKDGGNGYKVIEVNISNTSDNLYAVVTPVNKM
ncbi:MULTISPECIES: hypothetical protein [Bacillaceae]|mgnify:CR=1 FL=1|uniref:Uncharacterized protein n=1 Tax=Metabacillus endolithicus TaxID=1535204 RepID=A0ABW5BR64_9BACI|nr:MULTISPECIES: hypothetical protein [Bacillaceae]MCM3161484.1 hypothetical protein [Metabacillus litoralis]MCM3409313.1 hypothetical protein [Metabacillus litoralis]UGB32905.1 hypothetical protein LPC09_10985 [Metabacillus sp. B2-18]UHA59087.1 hypothetical protein KDJ21_020055 [Metabacillus litoralis]UPG63440.1 hypothetical protein MVE64_24765 [Metabacillus endolithicus]